MGVLKQGILGGFSGKVGTVVGAFWKGIPYIRGLAPNITDPQTPAQMAQRARMAFVVGFLKPSLAFLRVGYRAFANGQSAFNAATSYVSQNAVTGTSPNYSIDYANALVSRGSLTGVEGGTASENTGNIVVSWTDNSDEGFALSDDEALILMYNPTKAESKVVLESGVTRSAGTASVAIPGHFSGDAVHVFLAFRRPDGSMISDSTYLDEVTLS